MSCTARWRKPPRSAASHNLLKPCPSPARRSGSRRGKSKAEPLPLPRRQERQAAPTELTGDRGTDGSNPSPSSAESANYRFRAGLPTLGSDLQQPVGLLPGPVQPESDMRRGRHLGSFRPKLILASPHYPPLLGFARTKADRGGTQPTYQPDAIRLERRVTGRKRRLSTWHR